MLYEWRFFGDNSYLRKDHRILYYICFHICRLLVLYDTANMIESSKDEIHINDHTLFLCLIFIIHVVCYVLLYTIKYILYKSVWRVLLHKYFIELIVESTTAIRFYPRHPLQASVAQWLCYWPHNPGVSGLIPGFSSHVL